MKKVPKTIFNSNSEGIRTNLNLGKQDYYNGFANRGKNGQSIIRNICKVSPKELRVLSELTGTMYRPPPGCWNLTA